MRETPVQDGVFFCHAVRENAKRSTVANGVVTIQNLNVLPFSSKIWHEHDARAPSAANRRCTDASTAAISCVRVISRRKCTGALDSRRINEIVQPGAHLPFLLNSSKNDGVLDGIRAFIKKPLGASLLETIRSCFCFSFPSRLSCNYLSPPIPRILNSFRHL